MPGGSLSPPAKAPPGDDGTPGAELLVGEPVEAGVFEKPGRMF